MLTLLCTLCVPELSLLLVSGVLECWKHLAGRFNIQLTGSQTSYITAENPAHSPHTHSLTHTPSHTPTIILISWPVPHPLPLPLEWSLHPSPLSPVLALCLSSEGVDSQLCSSVSPSTLLLIAFDLNGLFFIWRLLPPHHHLSSFSTSTPNLLSGRLALKWSVREDRRRKTLIVLAP